MTDQVITARPFLIPGLVLAVAFLLAVGPMPYAFYDFLRILVLALGAWAAVLVVKSGAYAWLLLIVPVVVLWNPVIPIHLNDRAAWVPFDVVAAVGFGFFAAYKQRRNRPPVR